MNERPPALRCLRWHPCWAAHRGEKWGLPSLLSTLLLGPQVQQHNGHVFASYQVNIPQSCEQCLSYIWLMDKALLCSGECFSTPASPTAPPEPPLYSLTLPPCPQPLAARQDLHPSIGQIFPEHCPDHISTHSNPNR